MECHLAMLFIWKPDFEARRGPKCPTCSALQRWELQGSAGWPERTDRQAPQCATPASRNRNMTIDHPARQSCRLHGVSVALSKEQALHTSLRMHARRVREAVSFHSLACNNIMLLVDEPSR